MKNKLQLKKETVTLLNGKTILLLFIVFTLISCSPNPRDILVGSYEKCQSIRNGYYEMDNYWKMMSRNDTIKISQKSHFEKAAGDPIIPIIFNSYLHSPELGEINLIYNGENLVSYSGSDGFIIPRNGNENDIWEICVKNHAFSSYLPITYEDSRPLPSPSILASGKFTATYVKEEPLNGVKCHHIKAIVPEEYDPSVLRGYGLIIKTEINYWINKQDSIPLQFTVSRDLKVGNDTIMEFEKYVLIKYALNKSNDHTLFSLQSMSPHISLRNPEPSVRAELLKTRTTAPDWHLTSIKGDTLALVHFRGNLVLMDFFLASCPPCIEILPGLQNLHKKYKDRGLHVIGIDIIDSQKTLEYFVSRHNINYTILLGDHNVHEAYNISAYPTTYLIGREGEILFQHIGYDNSTLEKLDNIIQQQLK